MHSDAVHALTLRGRRGSPLGDALRRRRRSLALVFAVTTLLASAVVHRFDLVALSAQATVTGDVVSGARLDTFSTLRLALEAGLLCGLASTALVTTALLTRDRRVRLSRGVPQLLLGVVGFLGGASVARLALPFVLAFDGPAGGTIAATVDPVGVVELALFFPVAVGVGVALPALLVAAVRAGAVPRYTSTRQRGYATLAFVTLAATHSPADLTTFGLFALPPFAGFGVGLAWLELR
jgi:Sec-independent protein secretion pathway component TatC